MPAAMIWITLCIAFVCSTADSAVKEQRINKVNTENYILNLHYDHCKSPMSFSWKKLVCECPAPLTKLGGSCICDNCAYEDIQQWYNEGDSTDLPAYINEVFEEIDEDLEDSEKMAEPEPGKNISLSKQEVKEESVGNVTDKTEIKEEGEIKLDMDGFDSKLDSEEPVLLEVEKLEDDDDLDTADEIERRKRSADIPHPGQMPFEPVLLNLRGRLFLVRPSGMTVPLMPHPKRVINRWYLYPNYKIVGEANRRSLPTRKQRTAWFQPSRKSFDNTSPFKTRKVFFPKPKPKDLSKMTLLKLKPKVDAKPQSFSDSVVAGSMAGETSAGHDKAKGMVSSFRGTGAMALGSGGGGAGSAAFTGLGSSNMVVVSKGASAAGEAFIGEMAKDGSSTSSVLLGSGDAIAVNSLGGKGSSSAAGFSTKKTAGAASSAFGPASASVSATPGKGDVSSSAAFSDGINTAAGVEGEGGAVVESVAVGNPDQDIAELSKNKPGLFRSRGPIRVEPLELDFLSLFGGQKESGDSNKNK